MNGYRISDAARATGFSVSALRFYEKEGVVVPERTSTGYRSYRQDDLEALRFVARGKQLGLSLDDITKLLALLDDEQCAPVQSRIRHLIGERISLAHDQTSELAAFTAQLQEAAARLEVHTPEGACDETCGCKSQPQPMSRTRTEDLIPLAGSDSSAIACSLSPGLVGSRVDQWSRILASATGRSEVPGGIRVVFDRSVDVGPLVDLAVAEQSCCSFFDFAIIIGSKGVALEVTGPAEAQEVILALFGATARPAS